MDINSYFKELNGEKSLLILGIVLFNIGFIVMVIAAFYHNKAVNYLRMIRTNTYQNKGWQLVRADFIEKPSGSCRITYETEKKKIKRWIGAIKMSSFYDLKEADILYKTRFPRRYIIYDETYWNMRRSVALGSTLLSFVCLGISIYIGYTLT